MKEYKDIYDIKDILYEKFEYWDVEDLMKNINRIIDAKVEEKSEEIETEIEAEYIDEIESAEEERDEAEDAAEEWHDKYEKVLKELEELKGKQDDKETIPF